MSEATASYSMRDFAGDVQAAARLSSAQDLGPFRAALSQPIRRLIERDDLLTCGLSRPGNNVAESWYLYFDGDMSIVLFKVPMKPAVQPHDHGIWETLFVYRGQVRHSVYERVDDGTREGHARLEERSSGILGRGDFALVAPPQDIHGFEAVTEDTYGITVSSGAYKPERIYYRLEDNTCEIRRPRTLR
ncbi:MAG: hypothetical protein V4731_08520 [Pseudomonadota bacterium]